MGDAINRFRHTLELIRNTTAAGKESFFMLEDLRGIVTEALVAEITAPYISDHRRKRDVQKIVKNGVRLLCILVLMDRVDQMPNFLAHSTLDSRLPIIGETEFLGIAPDLNNLFYTEIQWQFFPWVFQRDDGHLIFPDRMILPFIKEDELSEGSGGKVSILTIPALQHTFFSCEDGQTVKVVRKRIKEAMTPKGTENKFNRERDCLDLYRSLRHPNIIPLLGSFTIRGSHNLLFPYFRMDLETFLAGERFGKFCDNVTFTTAVTGLASALLCVHELNLRSRTNPTYRTSYGYHHDIRPANILVTDETFILADFGLAYPKPQAAHEPPVTTWVENIGHYIAPECMDEFFEPQVIGRSYDIWAFGCLLTEIATYMELGPAGITNFRAKRTTQTFYGKQWVNGYFFEGRPSSNRVILKDQVSDWLHMLSKDARDRIIPSLVALSKKMLNSDPPSRPAMAVSYIRLSFIHVKQLFWSIIEAIERILSELGQPRLEISAYTTTELKLELCKLKAFGDVLGLNDTMRLDCELFREPSFVKFVEQCLEQISAELRRSRASLPNYMRVWTTSASQAGVVKELMPLKLVDEPIRQDIRNLCESLPDQGYFNDSFIKNLLASSRSESSLRNVEMYDSKSPGLYADTGLHAKLQRHKQALQQKMNTAGTRGLDIILDWSRVDIRETFSRNHHLGVYDTGGEVSCYRPQRVLIEWVLFSQFPEGESLKMREFKSFLILPSFCTVQSRMASAP